MHLCKPSYGDSETIAKEPASTTADAAAAFATKAVTIDPNSKWKKVKDNLGSLHELHDEANRSQ